MSFDEQPDGDIHADDPASYSAEGEEFPPVPTQLLWMFDGIDRKEATKMMHDYAASAIAWKPSAALRTAWERAQQAEDKARRLEDSLDACRPYMKEGETVTDAMRRFERSESFYRRRCEALQSLQSSMRDPERVIVCDILANGFTLDQPFAGDRYAGLMPDKARAAQEVE